ncbi:MAG TPA: hypothetical protein VM432_11110 [Bdellovibrionales bacterium]|nr:hypothetical protein [Bdellovibrionales bacterium]
MRRLLLVIDDYNELRALESMFRRLGMDVLSLGKDLLINDALLRFHPDLVIASAKGRAVDGLKLSVRLRKLSPAPKVAILHQQGNVPKLDPQMARSIDAFLESPLKPLQIIDIMAQLANLDAQSLLQKFEKISKAKLTTVEELIRVMTEHPLPGDKPEEEGFDPQKTPGVSPRLRTGRSDKYDQFLADHAEPVDGVVSQDDLKKAMAKLAKATAADRKESELVKTIDEERQAFAKALFTTKK